MKNKLHWVRNTVFATCNRAPTGDKRLPPAFVWTASTPGEGAPLAGDRGLRGSSTRRA